MRATRVADSHASNDLGVLPVGEAIARLNRPHEHHVIVAEMKDVYGDMGVVAFSI